MRLYEVRACMRLYEGLHVGCVRLLSCTVSNNNMMRLCEGPV